MLVDGEADLASEAARHPELGRGDFSTAFLSMYEDVKKRIKAQGMHASIQTLEKYQAMILVFMEKGRPLKPYELLDALIFNPSFSSCKDAKRMVFYVLQRLLRIGVVEKAEYKGSKGFYRLAGHPGVEAGLVRETISRLRDPRIRGILEHWRQLFELRSIAKLWRISSLGHALVYELHSLREKIAELEREEGGIPGSLGAAVGELIEIYADYTRTGKVPPAEADLFHQLEGDIKRIDRASWTTARTG